MKKILIIIAIIFGVIILFGFGYDFYKGRALKNEIGKYPDYYKQLAEDCESKASRSCCIASVQHMLNGSYKLSPESGCPENYQSTMLKCRNSYGWCEPKKNCIYEGEYVDGLKNSFECCAGLVKKLASPMDENCDPIIPEGSTGYEIGWTCLACGDGICNLEYENKCNCSEDCNAAPCVPAGKSADERTFGKYIGPKYCCDGLIKIPVRSYEKGHCYILEDADSICSNCGNLICEEWENKCNCSEDCK